MSGFIPIKWNRQQADKADDELKMNPVLDEVRQQSVEAGGHRPKHFDYCSSERSMFGGKQFARHHETRKKNALSTQTHDTGTVLYFTRLMRTAGENGNDQLICTGQEVLQITVTTCK